MTISTFFIKKKLKKKINRNRATSLGQQQ